MKIKVKIINKEPVIVRDVLDFCVIMDGRKFLKEVCDDDEELTNNIEKENYGGNIKEYRKNYIERIKNSGGNVNVLIDDSDKELLPFWCGKGRKVHEIYYELDLSEVLYGELDVEVPKIISKMPMEESRGCGIVGENKAVFEKMTDKQKESIRRSYNER